MRRVYVVPPSGGRPRNFGNPCRFRLKAGLQTVRSTAFRRKSETITIISCEKYHLSKTLSIRIDHELFQRETLCTTIENGHLIKELQRWWNDMPMVFLGTALHISWNPTNIESFPAPASNTIIFSTQLSDLLGLNSSSWSISTSNP